MRETSKRKFAVYSVLLLGASVPLTSCSAQAIPGNWQTDCVGRVQISMPELADVAAVTPASIDAVVNSSAYAKSYFEDGQVAHYSRVSYFGRVDATGPLSDQEIAALRSKLAKETTQTERHQLKRKSAGEKAAFAKLPTFEKEGVVWDFGDTISGRLFVARQYYAWGISAEPERRPYLLSTYKSLLGGLIPRKNFTTPTGAGVCIPHFFVSDDGLVARQISTSYRLRSHPDVMIVMEDASAGGILAFQNPDKFTAQSKTNFFWTQRYQGTLTRRSLSNDTIPFAGQKGLETRLKLGREDGSEDYGYSVFTRGDPTAKQDTPDLMLVVMRNAADAKAKGRTPISEDEFFKLAKSVAASVKARPAVKQIDK
jgi:hypothetical protein